MVALLISLTLIILIVIYFALIKKPSEESPKANSDEISTAVS